MSDHIPVDDISDVYMEATPETRRAISNILTSGDKFVAASYAGQTPSGMNMVNVDWNAGDPNLYLFLAVTIVQMGRKQFGEVWLNQLAQNLSQME